MDKTHVDIELGIVFLDLGQDSSRGETHCRDVVRSFARHTVQNIFGRFQEFLRGDIEIIKQVGMIEPLWRGDNHPRASWEAWNQV